MAIPQITWEDVQQLPDDGNRYEAIGGELYVTPAPSFRHQRVSHRLGAALHRILDEPGLGYVVAAPLGVVFPATEEGVQPDLTFVAKERRSIIHSEGIRGAPNLVIEILSPSTAARDRGVKLKLYERQGVEEYWIIDPEDESVEVWRFRGEPRQRRVAGRLPVRLGEEAVGEIDLAEIFRED